MLRRLIEMVLCGTGLLVLAVPLAVIGLAIKLTSAGPVFYCQQRVGRGGKPFTLFKFRTMRVANAGPSVTAQGDPRITALGWLLRRTKLDELPQLWNVLRGDMSLIGPRPEVTRYVEHYTAEQRRILDYRPGLAGAAALAFAHEAELLAGCADAEEVERVYLEQIMPRKLALDLEYEQRRTLRSDLRLAWDLALSIAGRRRGLEGEFHIEGERPVCPPREATGRVGESGA